MAMARRLLLATLLLLTAGCGEATTAGPGAEGDLLQTARAVTVLDDGDGPELCLGGVAESLPPQCGGPALAGWDWADHTGDFEEVRGTRWGDFQVVGTYDGTTFTVTEVTPAAELPDTGQPEEPEVVTPCQDVPVVDPSRTSRPDLDAAVAASNRLEGLAYRRLDTSRDERTPEEMDADAMAGDDDVSAWVLDVRVTREVDDAEAALRQHWGGGLCVTQARHSQAELRRIQRDVADRPDHLSSWVDLDQVGLHVVLDEGGALQDELDAAYGDGVVRVSSALIPVRT
jgi:hypothetical protein